MSSTTRKLTQHKWVIWINDMPKVELAIGSIVVTIEHERSDTRLEYRDLPVLQYYLRYLLSCFYPKIHLQDLWNRFQFILYQNLRHFEENLLDRGVFIRPPANFRQSFASFWVILCEPCSQNSKIFLLRRNFSPSTRGPLGCLLGFWPSGPKPCGGNDGSWREARARETCAYFHTTRVSSHTRTPPTRDYLLQLLCKVLTLVL